MVLAVNLRLLADALVLAAVGRGTASSFLGVRIPGFDRCSPIMTARPDSDPLQRAHPQRRVLDKHREKEEQSKAALEHVDASVPPVAAVSTDGVYDVRQRRPSRITSVDEAILTRQRG